MDMDSLFSENEKKRIYCGDGDYYYYKSSRALPIGIWLVLFFCPFLLLTILSNVTDPCFLVRNPSVLLFGNISHFQITPHNFCCRCCSDVKLVLKCKWKVLNSIWLLCSGAIPCLLPSLH